MGNVLRGLARDLKRIAKAPATWAVLLFLIVLPSLYAWLNIYAFWDPYGQTGNLRVCVVNQDEGTDDGPLGTLDLGGQVVEALKGNDQLGWAFTDYDEAMDELASGRAYGVFVIPADFSAKVATIVTGDFQQPQLEYYVNEKEGPISPKITDTGADELDATINDTFFSTVSASIVQTIAEKRDEGIRQVEESGTSAAAELSQAAAEVERVRGVIAGLQGESDGLRRTIGDDRGQLTRAQESLGDASGYLEDTSHAASATNGTLTLVWIDTLRAFDDFAPAVTKTEARMNASLGAMQQAVSRARSLVQAIPVQDPEWQKLADSLAALADSSDRLGSGAHDAIGRALDRIDAYRRGLSEDTVPVLSRGLGTLSDAAGQLGAAASNQSLLIGELSLQLEQLDALLELNGGSLAQADSLLEGLQDDLELAAADLAALESADTLRELFGDEGPTPEEVAAFMESPTRIETEVLYPVESFGSAMAPLFINLTLWIGVFMLMVIMRLEVDSEGMSRFTIAQRYLSRFLLLAIPATLQAAVCCAGCLLLGVQVHSTPLFFLSAIVAALAYLAIQYSLSVTLQHVGKALCIILIFVQIPGGTGLYPIELTPGFFQAIYPWFPFTYSIGALRETIGGFYDGLWLHDMALLGVFFAVFMVLGLAVRPLLTNLNRMVAAQVRQSAMLNGEAVELPARRYRTSQIIRSLADHEGFRTQVERRAARFIAWYPRMRRGALAVVLAGVVLTTAILGLLHAEKVAMLTAWLLWFIAAAAFYTGAEYLRDYLNHLASLDDLDMGEVRALLSRKDGYAPLQPVRDILGRAAPHGPRGKGGGDA